MPPELPDHVRSKVLQTFGYTHADTIKPAVAQVTDLGGGHYRVKLAYVWLGRTFTPEYRYVAPAADGPPLVRQIHGYHGDVECWGAFCSDCDGR